MEFKVTRVKKPRKSNSKKQIEKINYMINTENIPNSNELLKDSPDFKGEYPLAFQAILAGGHPNILKRFEKIIPLIQDCLEKKEIISTQMTDVKYYGNEFVSQAYKSYVDSPFTYAGKYAEQHMDLQMISTPYEIRSIGSFAKKLAKVAPEAKETAMYKAAYELTQELSNFFEVFQYLKEHTIKASDKKKQEKEAKEEIENTWHKELTSHKDSQVVIGLLKEKATLIEEDIYKSHLQDLQATVKIYQKKCLEGESDYTKIFEKNISARMTIQSITERVYDTNENYYSKIRKFKVVHNYQEIEKEARRYASDIVNHFVYKNASKLSVLLYHKNNLETASINNVSLGRGYVECDIKCEFKDGSEFIANSSVVLSYSKYDKPFYRYPTIFQNVKLPDGSYLSGPSEQKMDEVFAKVNTNVVTNKPKMK
jgi:hypothetical protein